MKNLKWKRFLFPGILLIGLIIFFYFRLYDYLSFHYLKTNRELLLQFVHQHFILSLFLFVLIYIALVAISAPGAVFLSLAGGFLFGTIFGVLLVVISAACGATIIFLVAKTFFHDFFYQRTGKWFKKMSGGFKKNAVSYLLFLRLVPLFPFWLVNIVPAFFDINVRTFFWTTLLGILPGSIVYVSLGSGLGFLFEKNQSPRLSIIFEPKILFPILGLAILSLIPIIYKRMKK